VYPVPRPSNIGPKEKWNKFCLVSKDHKTMKSSEFLDKHEIGYNDFVSCHIKVHGMNVKDAPGVQLSWTRRLKEYMESNTKTGKFPVFFNHTDERGDVVVGKRVSGAAKRHLESALSPKINHVHMCERAHGRASTWASEHMGERAFCTCASEHMGERAF
jgi:hypothetical protein